MGKKTLTNSHCLIELTERATTATLRRFSAMAECHALKPGFDWTQDDDKLGPALLEHVKHLKKDHREPAEREALRVLRLSSSRGATILCAVALQLNDNDLAAVFSSQEGGELGRSVWMRTYSDETLRLFDVAESILNTGDLRGDKRLYDAFDVPGDEPPPFIWNDSVKKDLEAQMNKVLHLDEPCQVVYVPLVEDHKNGGIHDVHYLVVRFAGKQVGAMHVVAGNRKTLYYFPARDATLAYSPHRRMVEVNAYTVSTRFPLVNVLSKYGFKAPLSNRPLNQSRYDLSPFCKPLADVRPKIDGAKVEKLYLIEARALLGHSTDAISLHMESGDELHDVMAERWKNHPFRQPGSIVGVTLVADLVLDGQTDETVLSIVLAEPGRCSLQSERDPRLRQCGTQLLEALGVLKPLHPGSGMGDPKLISQVSKLLEQAASPMDGFALAQLGIDIDRFEDEGILTEGGRIKEKVVESASGERYTVTLERSADETQVLYRDPLTGLDVTLLAKHARRWNVNLSWLREEIVTALGTALQMVRGPNLDEEPIFLGEMEVDGHPVALYFAARMSNDRQFAKIDSTLRLQPRSLPGIVLTTATAPFPFAGTNVVIPIDSVLANAGEATVIDLKHLKAAYRHGQLAATGGSLVSLKVSADGYSAVLSIPGRAPWRVTNKAKVTVLQRLVDAYSSGTSHVNTKILMADTGCLSPSNLFTTKNSPWRDYLVKVQGAHAWQLKLAILDEPIDDDEAQAEEVVLTANA